MRERSRNLFVVNGLIKDILFEDAFGDVLISGHVFGDFVNEFSEMLRVVENDGTMLLFPTKCNSANNIHRSLTGKGYERISLNNRKPALLGEIYLKRTKHQSRCLSFINSHINSLALMFACEELLRASIPFSLPGQV